MKPIHYVSKYNLNKGVMFNHNDFIKDLTIDFLTLLEVGKSLQNIKGYENAVRAIRMKWDGIDKKTLGKLPDKLWNFFYATVIVKMKEEAFPVEMNRRKEEKARRKEERARWNSDPYGEDKYYNFFEDMFFGAFMRSLFKGNAIPIESFSFLRLEKDATIDDVKTKFRNLSMQYHPDKGGDKNMFAELVEHKNRCLAYLERAS